MNSARKILSPVKQNQLPSTRSPFQNSKGNLNEIMQYLKENGIKLPTHLHAAKNPQQFSLKLNPISDSNKQSPQIKALKIKLSDTQFELKKLEEDFAQYKRLVKIEKDKQQKKFQQNFQRLKQDSKQNNQDYDFQKEKQFQKHKAEIQKLRCQYSLKFEKIQKQLTLKHSAELNKIRHKSASQLQSLQIESNRKYSNLHKQLTDQMQQLKKEFEKQKHNISLRNKQKLQENLKKYESTYLALQSQKKTQQKLHQKTKHDFQKQKEKLFGQLCFERNIKKNLEDELSSRNKQIKQLKGSLNDLKIQMEIVKQNTEQQKQWMRDQHEKQIEHLHDQYQKKISKILDSHTEVCQKYQRRIQKLNYFHQQSEKVHESKLQDLSFKFDQRLSKPEDLDEIKKLTESIVKRDQQIRKLTRELKYRNLQIENKEEVYNKIFKSSTRMREQKKVLASINKCEYPIPKLERDSWSKESLFRKSQTADVKFILKNMNKTKRQKCPSKDNEEYC